MRWLRQILCEYGEVIIAMLIAGAIMGSCRAIETPPPTPLMVPMMRVRDCQDARIIRLMPNWIRNWDPPKLDRRT